MESGDQEGVMSSATEADLKALAAEVANLRGDVAKITATMQDLLRHGSDDASYFVQRRVGRVHEEFERAKQTMIKSIEDQPIAAALTSFGVGMFLGILCRRG
jgi:ElaB/YqjD/DUF883 family membrane-anchored ribosome-binding protein